MASDFNLNLLPTFAAVYRERTLTQAAKRLGLSVSTVSARLEELRHLYADPLFSAQGKQLEPTATAQALFPLVERAIASCSRALPSVMESGKRYPVVIAMSDDFELVLGRLITDLFARELPQVQPVFRQTNALLVEKTILTREADFAVTAGGSRSEHVVHEHFGFHHDCCIYERQKGEKPLTREEYAARRHVVVHYGSSIGVADGLLQSLGIVRQVDAVISSFSALPCYLCGTKRVSLGPVHAAQWLHERFPSIGYCPKPFPEVKDPVELRYRADVAAGGAHEKALGMLRRVLGQFDWSLLPEMPQSSK